MGDHKAFRIDWYPHAAFTDLMKLEAVEIGVFTQIMNLIYMHNGAIEYDAKHIGKTCGLGRKGCDKVIQNLIHKEFLFINLDKKLSQKRCEIELEKFRERSEKASKNGKKGAEIKRENKGKQLDSVSNLNFDDLASTNIKTNTSNSINTDLDPASQAGDLSRFGNNFKSVEADRALFNIDDYLSDSARDAARLNAGGWDQKVLMRKYNEWVNSEKGVVPNNPDAAYPAWCKKFTKGKPP